ncbi:hypothetical protein DFP72DRAFT_859931 [Ephemerocybe angulata]|uniref:Uncharacterized protein n=1 Tax=Ephemerocybe angulata TaxID=980116 RepID=A0A8H6LUL1_9AGAR|nr:hypothetical protein DFP72DRAFT_859931 [Tulosesus angulatus]
MPKVEQLETSSNADNLAISPFNRERGRVVHLPSRYNVPLDDPTPSNLREEIRRRPSRIICVRVAEGDHVSIKRLYNPPNDSSAGSEAPPHRDEDADSARYISDLENRVKSLERSNNRLKGQLERQRELRKDIKIDLEEARTQLLNLEEKAEREGNLMESLQNEARRYPWLVVNRVLLSQGSGLLGILHIHLTPNEVVDLSSPSSGTLGLPRNASQTRPLKLLRRQSRASSQSKAVVDVGRRLNSSMGSQDGVDSGGRLNSPMSSRRYIIIEGARSWSWALREGTWATELSRVGWEVAQWEYRGSRVVKCRALYHHQGRRQAGLLPDKPLVRRNE